MDLNKQKRNYFLTAGTGKKKKIISKRQTQRVLMLKCQDR